MILIECYSIFKSMKIVLVVDYFGNTTNGTTMTARHLYKQIEARGHEVAVITGVGNGWPNVYECGIAGICKFPIAKFFFDNNGFYFAKTNWDVIKKALEGADLVHFLADFPMERQVKKYCDKQGIKTFAAFHIQPENATYQLKLGWCQPLNWLIYRIYRNAFFDKFDHIHCPSKMIANELKRHHYSAQLHVISNGIGNRFHQISVTRPEEEKDYFIVTMVGRITHEKRQDLVVKACAKSKYADKIKLYLFGRGTWTKKITKMAKKKLKNEPFIGFVTHDELIKILNYSDLYIQASDIEIEAISCMEGFACGTVPVISDSRYSATSQFALTEHSVFKAGSYKDLAKKIDYWYEHPDEKKYYEKKYAESAKDYDLEKCNNKLIQLFEDYYHGKI